MSILFLYERLWLLLLQCHSHGFSAWAAQELRGHAGTDVGRKGIFGHWIPTREGMQELTQNIATVFLPQRKVF